MTVEIRRMEQQKPPIDAIFIRGSRFPDRSLRVEENNISSAITSSEAIAFKWFESAFLIVESTTNVREFARGLLELCDQVDGVR